ncbi:hypothetical protein EVAR_39186_1 [Eumeta japonica]|uniref:Uncharacterized protein n=1 Tax=Eumeta variegata TaxID=151549 RepID=A0A4C1VLI4_EUMVA|nr:hypothetical protein EVAR_39186_1 [Eumeta japonica]
MARGSTAPPASRVSLVSAKQSSLVHVGAEIITEYRRCVAKNCSDDTGRRSEVIKYIDGNNRRPHDWSMTPYPTAAVRRRRPTGLYTIRDMIALEF